MRHGVQRGIAAEPERIGARTEWRTRIVVPFPEIGQVVVVPGSERKPATKAAAMRAIARQAAAIVLTSEAVLAAAPGLLDGRCARWRSGQQADLLFLGLGDLWRGPRLAVSTSNA